MRILFVEDNETFVSQIQPLLLELEHVSEVRQVRSRDAAIAAFEAEMFDLVILDLTIPPEDGSLEVAPEHGQTVFHEVRRIAPGMTIFILTGSEPDEFTRRLVRYGENLDLWGTGRPRNTVDYFIKEEVDQLLERVTERASVVAGTDAVNIDYRGRDLGLSERHQRIVKVFARRAGGVSCELKSLSGGLSEARVVRAIAKDDQGRHLAVCAAKLGTHAAVTAESQSYEQHVSRLRLGAFPPVFVLSTKVPGA
jgi:CheY-like chemotaxis protein